MAMPMPRKASEKLATACFSAAPPRIRVVNMPSTTTKPKARIRDTLRTRISLHWPLRAPGAAWAKVLRSVGAPGGRLGSRTRITLGARSGTPWGRRCRAARLTPGTRCRQIASMHLIRGLGAHPTLRWTLAALATGACGENIDISTGESLSSTSTSSSATTEDASTAPTTGTPTTSGGTSSTSGGTVGADDSSTGDTSTGPSETGSSSTGEGTSSSSSGETSSSSGETGTSSSETGSSTGDESSSSTGDEVFACGAPPMPDQSQAPQLAGCSQVDESLWCLTLGNGNVTAVGLDTQSSCPVVQLQSNEIEVFAVGSIGVVGSDVFTCTSEFDGLVARVSLIDGAVEVSPTPCSAVTVWRGRILVQDQIGNDGTLDIYDSWADVTLGQVLWSFNAPGIFSETLNTQADVLYAAWHSDDHVDRFELPCGEPLGPVMFEGFDDWMQGIAVSDDLRFLTFGFSYNGVVAFDAGTGAALPAFPGAPIDGVGLACFLQP